MRKTDRARSRKEYGPINHQNLSRRLLPDRQLPRASAEGCGAIGRDYSAIRTENADNYRHGAGAEIDQPLNTLRARFCLAKEGRSTGDCSPLSAPTPPFTYDDSLSLRRWVSVGEQKPPSDVLEMKFHTRFVTEMPLGMALPVGKPELRFDARGAGRRGGKLRIVIRGGKHGRRYLRTWVRVRKEEVEVVQAFPAIEQAIRDGERTLSVQIKNMWGHVNLGMAEHDSKTGLRGPHLTGQTM